MFSSWKDLLFLHHPLQRRQDLAWRPDPPAPAMPGKVAAKRRRVALASCAGAWPRIMQPR
jgi:hypothetical protein